MSQGPLIPEPVKVSRARPWLSSTIRQPACAVAEVPSDVGSEPTMTQPDRSATSAVLRPTPPGQAPGRCFASSCANCVTLPLGETWTIVVPVPCAFPESLKLLTRTSPRSSAPTEAGTTATPYGLTSPFAGTVEAIGEKLVSIGLFPVEAVAVAASASPAVSVRAAIVVLRLCAIRVPSPRAAFGHDPPCPNGARIPYAEEHGRSAGSVQPTR